MNSALKPPKHDERLVGDNGYVEKVAARSCSLNPSPQPPFTLPPPSPAPPQ